MTTRLRAGLVGLGAMGRHHARVLRTLDGVQLVAAADPAGDKYGAASDIPVLSGVEQLLGYQLDYCVVASPTADHEHTGMLLAEASVHTLIEKPLALDGPAAHRLADAFDRAGLIGAVGHTERYNPALRNLRTRLDLGELGTIYQVATRRQGPFPNRIADVGVVKDLATHDIDLAMWVTRRDIVQVSAHTATRSGSGHEDLVVVVGRLDDGTITNHLVNWLSPLKERVTIVTGARGCLVADTLTADITHYANGSIPAMWDALEIFRGVTEGDVTRYAIAKPEPLLSEHTALRDAVLGQGADIVPMRQAAAAVTVADAVLESAAANTAMRVNVRDREHAVQSTNNCPLSPVTAKPSSR